VDQQMSGAEGVKGGAGLAALSLLYAPGVASVAAGGALVYGAPLLAVAYSPVWLANKMMIDPKNRELVQATFNRRRLVLPVELAPGTSVTGRVFFPLTPGPERIIARGRSGDEQVGVTVELPGLAGLHFTSVPSKAELKEPRHYRSLLDEFKQPFMKRKVSATGKS
jgi:hypothetical protein